MPNDSNSEQRTGELDEKTAYVRKPVEDGLTEEGQREACKKAAEAAGHIVTEQ